MLLAIDIGNTNIKMAIFKGKRILYSWRLVTDKKSSSGQHKKVLKKLFLQKKINPAQIKAIIICSVVPKLTLAFKKALAALFNKRPLILGQDIIAPIKNLYKRPQQVGQDRLANAVAAFTRYGGPVIVVDFGTALTFDVISAKGSYLGGVIVPGMEASLKSLIKNADLLPKINFKKPKALLGRETIASMQSGIVYGYSFLIEGILAQLKRQLKLKPQVIATGGRASLMADCCQSINKVHNNLTLEGLRQAYKKSKKNS
ncbi:MAG: type III pantothenate kinase [Omnitrophica bacterium]|nr:type III pantothenate kinase [Candidatus Omnitrophota bacterium]